MDARDGLPQVAAGARREEAAPGGDLTPLARAPEERGTPRPIAGARRPPARHQGTLTTGMTQVAPLPEVTVTSAGAEAMPAKSALWPS